MAERVSTPAFPRIASLFVYPLKSAGGISLSEARVDEDGLAHDRRWMIVDAKGRFVTQRSIPRMALLRTLLGDGVLRVTAPGMAPLELPVADEGGVGVGRADAPPEEVAVWELARFARGCGPEAAAWASEFLGLTCRVLHALAPEGKARLDGCGRVRTGFADGYPALVVSAASLADLNGRLPEPLPVNRFRPNLVVEDVPAYAEDRWRRVRVGSDGREVTVLGRKRCRRCAITTTDQETGERGVEPLRTLAKFRRTGDGEVAFGVNVGFEGSGLIRVGDEVSVEEAG